MINTREWKKARRNHISAVFNEVSMARNACTQILRIFRTNFTFEACLIQGTACFVYKFICVCNRVISGHFLRYLNDNCQGYLVSHIQMDSDRYRAIEYDIHHICEMPILKKNCDISANVWNFAKKKTSYLHNYWSLIALRRGKTVLLLRQKSLNRLWIFS